MNPPTPFLRGVNMERKSIYLEGNLLRKNHFLSIPSFNKMIRVYIILVTTMLHGSVFTVNLVNFLFCGYIVQ